jgi:NADH-quinone oxidoreductase subunit J
MTVYAIIFYVVAGFILVATGLAITRRHPVHAVVYLILSFLGSALLFYLLGAPFLAALEIIIYAGAIMVLFLFVIMLLRGEAAAETGMTPARWAPAIILGLVFLSVAVLLVLTDPRSRIPLEMAAASPKAFGRFIFEKYWLSVEIISLILLVGLMAVIQLGKSSGEGKNGEGLTQNIGKQR